MEATSQWLRATVRAPLEQIDREKGIIRGVIGAEEGLIKDGRGEFDKDAIKEIVNLAKEKGSGLKSRFGHPSLSADGVGTFLGRFHNPRSTVIERNGVEVLAAKFDMHLDESAKLTPKGDLWSYILTLAETDPQAFMTSLVLQVDEEHRIDKQGRPLLGEDGEPLPPLWTPTVLHALDVVDEGAATNSFLAIEPQHLEQLKADDMVRFASMGLDKLFEGQTREVVEARVLAWLDRYLDGRYGVEEVGMTAVQAGKHTWRVTSTVAQEEPPKAPAIGSKEWLKARLKR